ncbi:M43 family zinc metalloprotease [Paenimyroides baculatum]|uniref:M43 family zinc metalloprotease n=1 Tax=Paenimyroides baculatum TaxID=2608000 RepID=UPI001680B8F4|nr:M43 family zinc metalloprotease [Paenimyroides baculatum]
MNAQTEQHLNNCGTEYVLEKNFDSQFEKFYQSQIELKSKNPVTYYIPVVFHIIHAGEALGIGSNISDIDVYTALEVLNNNFKNNHNHTNGNSTSIQFVLATKAPNGSCSTGINRINFSNNQTYIQYGNRYSATDNGVDATTIRALSNWNPTQYYNIWVVNKITAAQGVSGYAYFPTEHGKIHDGTIISYQYLVGESSKTLTHELGHSLNLMHTFQGSTGTNCPAQINGCGADGDCVSDTPPHPQTHANDLVLTAANNCSGNNNSTYKHNYMSYARHEYRNVFTPLQIARMQSAIPFYRSSYLPATNSVFKMTQAPQSQFLINNSISSFKQFFCIGTPISLKNTSTCFLNTFNSTTLVNYTSKWVITKNGQTILTSTEPNPTITLNQVGTYSIALTSTNNLGSNSIIKSNIIEILPQSSKNYCTPTSFNVGNFVYSINNVKLNYINNSTAIGINNGYTDFSCTHITKATFDKPNKIDITVSNNHTSVKDNLILQGYIDYNDNGTFESSELILQETVPPSTNNKVYSYNFTPPTNVKKGEVLRMRIISERTSITNAKLNCTTQYNIGDIEDYGVIFESYLSSNEFEKQKYNIYPNPAENTLNINSDNSEEKLITIYTNSGQLIKSLKTTDENLSIDVSQISSGTYILNINNVPYKFIKK